MSKSRTRRVKDMPRSLTLLDRISEVQSPPSIAYTQWIVVGDADDPLAPDFNDPWHNAGGSWPPAAFYLSEDGEVRLRGHIIGGSPGTVAFTLPSGFRPEYSCSFIVPGDTSGYSVIRVDPNGDVTVVRTVG